MSDKPTDPATLPPELRRVYETARVRRTLQLMAQARLNRRKAARQEADKR